MKKSLIGCCLAAFLALSSFQPLTVSHSPLSYGNFTMNLCKSGHNGEVQSGDLYFNYTRIGYVIALNRTSKRVKAKYFAYKDNNTIVHDRYDSWRVGKNVVLISSGAYATGFNGTDKPVGLTVDNGKSVNDRYDTDMDGLIIVEDVGGIRATNTKDGDLLIKSKTKGDRIIDIKNSLQKAEFLQWCSDEKATVFQTHLLIYKNQLKFKASDNKEAERKMLVLAKDKSGNVYHFIVYSKLYQFTLYEMASNTLQMLNSSGYEVIAAANLDTGRIDVLSTSTELYDCSDNAIEGKTNSARRSMTNMLAYYYE